MHNHYVNSEHFRKDFWDNKILEWEESKYNNASYIDFNSSVKYRQKIALEALKKHIAGKTVIELGCGSAKLMDPLLRAGAQRYIGFDISQSAIDAAKSTASQNALTSKVELIRSDIKDISNFEIRSDICFSLGLLDWITWQEIEMIFSCFKHQYQLHSYSEKSISPPQLLHRLYVFIKYGHKNTMYTPSYYDRNLIKKTFYAATHREAKIYADRKLSFGRFIHNLLCF